MVYTYDRFQAENGQKYKPSSGLNQKFLFFNGFRTDRRDRGDRPDRQGHKGSIGLGL